MLCDGKGFGYRALLREADARKLICRFDISDPTPCDTEPPIPITLYQSLPKGDKAELIIQKCVELGVNKIIPLYTAHSLVRDAEKKTIRYARIALSAAEQCMRGIVPEVTPPRTFGLALAGMETNASHMAALSPSEMPTLGDFCDNAFNIHEVFSLLSPTSIGLWVGPEGGFSQGEVAALVDAGVMPITLGKRVLRTETAALTALAQINLMSEMFRHDLPR